MPASAWDGTASTYALYLGGLGHVVAQIRDERNATPRASLLYSTSIYCTRLPAVHGCGSLERTLLVKRWKG